MDNSLVHFHHEAVLALHQCVLILVVMDNSLVLEGTATQQPAFDVLILVVMDNSLVLSFTVVDEFDGCLNPCCNGQ